MPLLLEQIDSPARIVLNPSTEYVAKFTNDVPREKVLRCGDVMEKHAGKARLSNITVASEAIIKTVVEAVLNEEYPVPVTGKYGDVVGVLNKKTIIHLLFGKTGNA